MVCVRDAAWRLYNRGPLSRIEGGTTVGQGTEALAVEQRADRHALYVGLQRRVLPPSPRTVHVSYRRGVAPGEPPRPHLEERPHRDRPRPLRPRRPTPDPVTVPPRQDERGPTDAVEVRAVGPASGRDVVPSPSVGEEEPPVQEGRVGRGSASRAGRVARDERVAEPERELRAGIALKRVDADPAAYAEEVGDAPEAEVEGNSVGDEILDGEAAPVRGREADGGRERPALLGAGGPAEEEEQESLAHEARRRQNRGPISRMGQMAG